ncbi:MAG: response regulator [Desulfobulbaceae bacterium]|nr:response regulator [Desulfobulbaceae bacterium]
MAESESLAIKILYVEDEDVAREQMVHILKRRAKELFVARNGHEGLALFREHGPELVLTDIRMPGMDGLAMVKEMRRGCRDTKIIMTTAFTDLQYMMEAIDLGVDQYVVKPIDIEKLLAAVDKCAENIAQRQVARQFQAERETLLLELQAALEKVKLLSGFLPICASCKKIRDDSGYWQQIESYIRDHSEAEFSHGICPDCARKLYPDYFHEG